MNPLSLIPKSVKGKIALALLSEAVDYLKDHPDKIDELKDTLAELIPGKVDDQVLGLLATILKGLGLK